jgi:hypothetical protein
MNNQNLKNERIIITNDNEVNFIKKKLSINLDSSIISNNELNYSELIYEEILKRFYVKQIELEKKKMELEKIEQELSIKYQVSENNIGIN